MLTLRASLALYYLMVGLAGSFTDRTYRQSSCSENQDCLPLSECDDDVVEKMVQTIQSSSEARQRLKKIICGFKGKEAKVCCPQSEVVVKLKQLKQLKQLKKLEEEEEEDYVETATCGISSSFSLLISGGEETAPGDWPWMALLRYSDPVMRCAGVLISSRHVLTAAHCVTDSLQEVALGEHDLSTSHDCLHPDEGCEAAGAQCEAAHRCAPPHVIAKVGKTSIHPRYRTVQGFAEFDVAILTLTQRLEFSLYIKPVCLPSTEAENYDRRPLTVLGWGLETTTFLSDNLSNTLKKLQLSRVPLWNCNQKYKSFTYTDLKPSHYCATSGEPGRSACRGDSGGPLVRELQSGTEYEVAGILSLGSRNCGNIDIPLIFTRVEGEVNSWIRREVAQREIPLRPA